MGQKSPETKGSSTPEGGPAADGTPAASGPKPVERPKRLRNPRTVPGPYRAPARLLEGGEADPGVVPSAWVGKIRIAVRRRW
jgi:hypothetical protein